MTVVEWVGIGLFTVALALAAVSVGMAQLLRIPYAGFIVLEAVGLWHVAMVGTWPTRVTQERRR